MIETRIAELQQQEQQALAQANACAGAVAELGKLLNQIEGEASPVEPTAE